jgi:plasmid stabilization system protein ParE
MEVRWSLPAAEDFERICEWIARDNPEAAQRVARTIYDGCASLKDFPNLGRASRRMTGGRELHLHLCLISWSIMSRPTRLRFPVFFTLRKIGLEPRRP